MRKGLLISVSLLMLALLLGGCTLARPAPQDSTQDSLVGLRLSLMTLTESEQGLTQDEQDTLWVDIDGPEGSGVRLEPGKGRGLLSDVSTHVN